MRTGLTPSTVQWCRCGRFRGRNLADSVAVRRRFRAGVGVFCQTLIILFAASSHSSAFKNIALSLHDCRRGGRRVDPEPCKRRGAASAEAPVPSEPDEGRAACVKTPITVRAKLPSGNARTSAGMACTPSATVFEPNRARLGSCTSSLRVSAATPLRELPGGRRAGLEEASCPAPAWSARVWMSRFSGCRMSGVLAPSRLSCSRIPIH